MADTDGTPRSRVTGQSVANYWAELIQQAQDGEVVAVMDKFGNEVAVMVSMEKWEQITMFIEAHQ